jgi:hypothetical protein
MVGEIELKHLFGLKKLTELVSKELPNDHWIIAMLNAK